MTTCYSIWFSYGAKEGKTFWLKNFLMLKHTSIEMYMSFLTDCTENEHLNKFFFLTFCCIVTPISGIMDHDYIIEKF